MNCLIRITIIFSMAAALIGLPLLAMAEQSPTPASTTNPYTAQLSAEDFSKLGVAKMLSGNYRGAIEVLTQAIRLNSNDVKAYSNRGLAHTALKQQQEAISDFNQALQLKPELATAYYNRGSVRSQLQDYQGALADFSQAIRLSPKLAEAHHFRCLVRYALGNKLGVIEDFKLATALYLQQGKLEQYLGLVNTIKKLQVPRRAKESTIMKMIIKLASQEEARIW